MTHLRSIIAVTVVGALTGFACDDGTCERSRLEMEAKWTEIRNTAAVLKRTPEWDDVPLAERKQRHAVWGEMAESAELARSSFETRQVTWPAAHKANAELSEAYEQAPAEAKQGVVAESFGSLLANAGRDLEQFEDQCR